MTAIPIPLDATFEADAPAPVNEPVARPALYVVPQPGPVPCTHTLGPLCCVAGDEGHEYGHVYESTSGVPDRHSHSSGE